ncbi:PAS domain S-box protein [archaeon]|nr:PAS domain S-box protein [archaeon]
MEKEGEMIPYESLFNNNRDGVLYFNEDIIVKANKTALEIFDAEENGLVGKSVFNFTLDKEESERRVEDRLRGIPELFTMEIKTKKGNKTIEVSATPIKHPGVTSFSIIRDVSERIRLETRYRTIFNRSIDPIFISNDSGIVFINSSGLKLFGVNDPEEILYNMGDQFVHPDSNFMYRYGRERRRGKKLPSRYNVKIIRRDGSTRTVEYNSSIVEWEGAPASLVIARDITEKVDFEKKIEQLHQNAQQLSSANSVKEIINIQNKLLKELVGYYGSVSFGYIKNNEIIFERIDEKPPIIIDIDGKGISAKAIRTREIQNVPDVEKETDYLKILDTHNKSSLVVPVIIDDNLVGVINLNSKLENAFTPDVVELVKLLSIHTGLAYTRIQHIQKEKKYQEKLRLLNEHAGILHSKENIDEIIQETFRIINEILGIALVGYFTVENNIVEEKYLGKKSIEMKIPLGYTTTIDGPGVIPKVVREKKEVYIPDTSKEPLYVKGISQGIIELRSEFAVPLMFNDKVIGVLNLESEKLNAFSEEDREILSILSKQVGSAIGLINQRQESENLLNAFLESATNGFELLDPDLNLLYINEARRGMSPEGAIVEIGQNVVGLYGGEREEKRISAYRRVFSSGEPETIYDSFKDDKGRNKHLIVNIFKVNENIGLSTIDISDRVNAEERLKLSEERYRKLIETSPDLIIEHDIDGNILFLNSATERFTGVDKECVGNHNITEMILPEFMEEARRRQKKRIEESTTSFQYELSLSNHLGELVPVLVRSTPIIRDGRTESILLMVRDISEYKRAQKVAEEITRRHIEDQLKLEQLSEMERLKSQFMNTATHEIRTPITSIKGYTELIEEALGEKNLNKVFRYFEVINRNVDRLEHLTDDLLDIQRIESGRMSLNLMDCKLSNILKQLESELHPILLERKQTLEIEIKDVKKMKCDTMRLNQVLVNLVGNASKYSQAGSKIKLIISRDKDQIVFAVSDEGIGIAPDDMTKLFKPFPDIHIEGVTHGSGLGLSVCYGIIELHGGKIWVESNGRDKGSTFKFTIPL